MARGRRLALIAASAALAVGSLAAAGCGDDDDSAAADTSGASRLPPRRFERLRPDRRRRRRAPRTPPRRPGSPASRRANPGATISYDPSAPAAGREQFVAGGTAYGGSDAALADTELTGAQKRCGGVDNLVEIPVYVSPIAIAYNLPGVDDLQLSPDTLAKIMNHKITKWNDPAIAADNPDADLPDTDITTVSRSDKSGTTRELPASTSPRSRRRLDLRARPTLAGQGRRVRAGHLGRRGRHRRRRGHDRLRRREPGRRPRHREHQGRREYVAAARAEAAAKILDESPRTTDPGKNVFTYDLKRDTRDARASTRSCSCPTRWRAPSTLGRRRPRWSRRYLNYVISPEGQQTPPRVAPARRRSRTACGPQIQPAVDAHRQLIAPVAMQRRAGAKAAPHAAAVPRTRGREPA